MMSLQYGIKQVSQSLLDRESVASAKISLLNLKLQEKEQKEEN